MSDGTDAQLDRPRVLFISYDGMLEPLGQSQVLPYVRGLAARGAVITVLSFEKWADGKRRGRLQSLQAELDAIGIRWIPLWYHKWPTLLATGFDVFVGLVTACRIVTRERVPMNRLLHASMTRELQARKLLLQPKVQTWQTLVIGELERDLTLARPEILVP